MSFAGVRTLCARAAVLALSAPLLMSAAVPASAATIGHAMTPAVESEPQVDFLPDSDADAKAPTPCTALIPLGCFGPDTIRAAYGLQAVLDQGITGEGQTIVIIDAFQDPTLETDVAKFDGFWGLPPLKLTKYDRGIPPFDPTSKAQVSFSLEVAIDVEWAHATAPDAAIVLVQAKSENDTDLVAATEFAVDNNLGDVITQSFGEAEMCASPAVLAQQHAVFQKAAERGMTVFASSGDKGAARQSCDGKSLVFSVSTPASDPQVTGVGGTHLVAGAGGAYISEFAWNTPRGASGGGFSTLYRRPGYQAPFQENNKARGVPDVAYNADGASGFIIVWRGMRAVAGGTSAGTPQWAGIVALADQAGGRRLGAINKTLYHIGKSDAYSSAFHDITSGNNTFMGITGYDAKPGWDAVTGLGTPIVNNLIPLLIDGQG
jgi:subtilase family serine protease